jgi:hypothetical protein
MSGPYNAAHNCREVVWSTADTKKAQFNDDGLAQLKEDINKSKLSKRATGLARAELAERERCARAGSNFTNEKSTANAYSVWNFEDTTAVLADGLSFLTVYGTCFQGHLGWNICRTCGWPGTSCLKCCFVCTTTRLLC